MKIFDGLHAFLWRDYRLNNCNTYLINGEMKILVDPGHYRLFGHVQNNLDALHIPMDRINVVVATHGHPDHMEAVTMLYQSTMFAMSEREHRFICEFAGKYFKVPAPHFYIEEGDLTIGENRFRILLTPGHSPGSLCIYWPERKALFAGDVVFNRGIGRTDLPGGDGGRLKESIIRIASLDIDFLLPGHGDIVAGKEAVQGNFQYIKDHWFNYL